MKTVAILLGGMMAAALATPIRFDDCTVTQTVKMKFCEKCDRVFEPEKLKVKTDKEGRCKECVYQERASEKPVDIEMCVKKVFACVCGGEPESCCGNCPQIHLKAGNCCDKKTIEKLDRDSRVFYICTGCAARSWWKDKVTHKADCQKKNIRKTCTQSGKAPHDS